MLHQAQQQALEAVSAELIRLLATLRRGGTSGEREVLQKM
jgi:hypothetical protein